MTSDNLPPKDFESSRDDLKYMDWALLKSKKASCEKVLKMGLQMPDKGDGPRKLLEGINTEIKIREESKSREPRKPTPRTKEPFRVASLFKREQPKCEEGLFFSTSFSDDEAQSDDDGRKIALQPRNAPKKFRRLAATNDLVISPRRANGTGAQPSKLGEQLCLGASEPDSSRATSPKRRRVDQPPSPQIWNTGAPLANIGARMVRGDCDFPVRRPVPKGKNQWKNEDSIYRIEHVESKGNNKKLVPQHPPWRGEQQGNSTAMKQPKQQKAASSQRKRGRPNGWASEKQAAELKQETIVLEGDSDEEPPAVADDNSVDPNDNGPQFKITMDYDLERALEGVGNVAYPKEGGKGMVMVSPRDLQRLDPTEFLNDNCIDLYIKVIESNCPNESRCHFFRSFFFGRLEKSEGYRGDNCRRPTKDVDLFEKDYVFVPIHQDIHWSLAIICFPGNIFRTPTSGGQPCILHLDSMGGIGHDTDDVCKVLRGYLTGEWSRKRVGAAPKIDEEAIPHKLVKHIPQQVNSWDCGLFLLTFMEFFSYVAPISINCHNLQDCKKIFPNFLQKKWFTPENAGLLRTKLRVFVYELFIEELADKNKQAVEMLQNQRTILLQTKSQYKGPEEIAPGYVAKNSTPEKKRCEELEGSTSVKLVRELEAGLFTE